MSGFMQIYVIIVFPDFFVFFFTISIVCSERLYSISTPTVFLFDRLIRKRGSEGARPVPKFKSSRVLKSCGGVAQYPSLVT